MTTSTNAMIEFTDEGVDRWRGDLTRSGWQAVRPELARWMLEDLVDLGVPLTRAELLDQAAEHEQFVTDSFPAPRAAQDPGVLAAAAESIPVGVDLARYATAHDLPPLRTAEDLLNLFLAAQVVYELPDGAGVPHLYPANPLPEPGDVLPLTAAERLFLKARSRMNISYEPASLKIIELFDPWQARHEEITTSLQRLARILGVSPYEAGQAVNLLLGNGDFTTGVDPLEAAEHKVFTLRCDWEAFDVSRIVERGTLDELTAAGGGPVELPVHTLVMTRLDEPAPAGKQAETCGPRIDFLDTKAVLTPAVAEPPATDPAAAAAQPVLRGYRFQLVVVGVKDPRDKELIHHELLHDAGTWEQAEIEITATDGLTRNWVLSATLQNVQVAADPDAEVWLNAAVVPDKRGGHYTLHTRVVPDL